MDSSSFYKDAPLQNMPEMKSPKVPDACSNIQGCLANVSKMYVSSGVDKASFSQEGVPNLKCLHEAEFRLNCGNSIKQYKLQMRRPKWYERETSNSTPNVIT